MKHLFLFLSFMLAGVFLDAHAGNNIDLPYTLKIELTGERHSAESDQHFCHDKEIRFLKDCLSDFEVKGKTYRYYRVVTCTADSIFIARPGDDDPLIGISPKEILSVKTIITCQNGSYIGWEPEVFSSGEYRFSIVQDQKSDLNMGMKINLCWDENCESRFTGYMYCSQDLGYRYIFKREGEYYAYGNDDTETTKLGIEN